MIEAEFEDDNDEGEPTPQEVTSGTLNTQVSNNKRSKNISFPLESDDDHE